VPSEVLTLQWRQVDFKAGIVRLEPDSTKNDEGRTFPFGAHQELSQCLEAQRKKAPKGKIAPWVFHRAGEPFLDEDGAASKPFRDAWKKACKAAGCPGRIPHDFRRTAVRNLVRAGNPEKVAMMLTGHKTRSVFDRYDIVNESDLRRAVGRLQGTGETSLGMAASKAVDGHPGMRNMSPGCMK
jgi:integrase